MASDIRVDKQAEGEFRVTVKDTRGQTTHEVTVSDDYYKKLTGGGIPAEELVSKSFEFLLEREPKESILRRFDLPLIGRYFPEYEREIRKRVRA